MILPIKRSCQKSIVWLTWKERFLRAAHFEATDWKQLETEMDFVGSSWPENKQIYRAIESNPCNQELCNPFKKKGTHHSRWQSSEYSSQGVFTGESRKELCELK